MEINLYLTFDNGDCLKAFQFYKTIFGGEFTAKMTYAEAPSFDVPEAFKTSIMHMSLPIGKNMVLMGCDRTPVMHKEDYNMGNHAQIAITLTDRSKTDDVFEKLCADGGKVEMPPHDMFWGSYFGSCTDKFGIKWMMDCTKPDPMDEVKKTVHTIKQQLAILEEVVATSKKNGRDDEPSTIKPVSKKAKVID